MVDTMRGFGTNKIYNNTNNRERKRELRGQSGYYVMSALSRL